MLFKKLFIIFLFLLSINATFAQTVAPEYQYLKLNEAAAPGKTTLERWGEDSITGSAMTLHRAIYADKIDKTFIDALMVYKETGVGPIPKIALGGVLGKTNEMIATLFTPPASGIQYIANTWDNILGKPAYAQGFGFKGLEFLLPLWKGTRNLVYVLSSIIFVVIGLMIILRVKISPQAVVTVQSAIPAVITTLILVTFSYAIAGLMIDVGNIIASIIIALLFNAKGIGLDKGLFSSFTPSSGFIGLGEIGTIFNGIITSVMNAVGIAPTRFTNLVNPDMNVLSIMAFRTAPNWLSLALLGGLISSVVTGIFLGSIGNIIGAGFGQAIGHGIGVVAGGAVGGILSALILPIILSIIIGIWLIKLYFGLIKVYVTIIFKIIIGPLEIAMGAFPNAKIGFSSWLLELFANIMVFPIVTIVFIILNIVTEAISYSFTTVWAPGLISSTDRLAPIILSACVGMAGLALISKLPDLIPQYIFMIKPSPFGQAIGQGLGDPVKLAKGGYNFGVDTVATGIQTGIGPFRNTYNRLEGLNPDQGVPKTVADTLRTFLKAK